MVLITNCDTSEVQKPSIQTLDLPSSGITSKRSPVLRSRFTAILLVRGDQLSSTLTQNCIQRIAVIGLIADQSLGSFFDESTFERDLCKLDFMRASAGHVHRDRKTRAVCNCHDLRTLAPLSFSDAKTPFFAGTNVPSIKHSDRSIRPRSRRSSAKTCRTLTSVPSRDHAWNRLWHVWYGGYRSGKSIQGAPVRKIQRTPLNTALLSFQGLPRPSERRRSGGSNALITAHCSSVKSMLCPPEDHFEPFRRKFNHL
jgi:hypothetical protein